MKSTFFLPRNHLPAMRVPLPGSSCSNCRFAVSAKDGPHCSNKNYQDWAGTSELIDITTKRRVMDAQQFCSDWYEPS